MPQNSRKPRPVPPLRLSPVFLAGLYNSFSDDEFRRATWTERKPEAFTLPPARRLFAGPSLPAISDQNREALETAAWQGDLRALAKLIRQDPRYMACPWTLAVAAALRHKAERAQMRWQGDRRAREYRDEARAGLDALAQAWKGVDQRGRHCEPQPMTVAVLGCALTKIYTEAMADRSIRLPKALTLAKQKVYRLGGLAWVHPDKWLPWLDEDVKHLYARHGLKTVVTDRMEKVFQLPRGRVKTLWKQGLSDWQRSTGTDSGELSKFVDAVMALQHLGGK